MAYGPLGESGAAALPLGLSLDQVQNILRSCFVPDRIAGSAFVKRAAGLDFLGSGKEPVTVLAFVRQTLQQERGRWAERDTTLRMFSVGADGEPKELDSKQRADLVRAVQAVSRVKDPTGFTARADLRDLEHDLLFSLRRPTEADVTEGVRHSVWPIAAVVLLP